MLETPHTLTGAALATKISNPFISLPLALVSHFILDRIPHWNPHLYTEKKENGKISKKSFTIVTLDSSIALASGTIIALTQSTNTMHSFIIITACFLSVLPDVIEAPYFFLNKKSALMEKWINFQKSIQNNAILPWGIITQIIISIAAIWWILA